jgi:hypothetical protein
VKHVSGMRLCYEETMHARCWGGSVDQSLHCTVVVVGLEVWPAAR